MSCNVDLNSILTRRQYFRRHTNLLHALRPMVLALLMAATISLPADIVTVTSIDDSGPGSLRQAISELNAAPGLDIVRFDKSLDGQTIQLTSGDFNITDDLIIDGSYQLTQGVTIDAGGNSRIFRIGPAAVGMDSLTLINGYAAGDQNTGLGGAIVSTDAASQLTLRNLRILGCVAEGGGGGIGLLFANSLTMENCHVEGNSAGQGGGLFANTISNATILDSAFVGNTAFQNGGGALLGDPYSDRAIQITRTRFEDNVADSAGGGVFLSIPQNETSDPQIDECEFQGNRASNGGAIWYFDGRQTETFRVTRSTFVRNTASNEGGVLWFEGGPVEFVNVTATMNQAKFGGVVFAEAGRSVSGNLLLLHCTLTDNHAQSGGGTMTGQRELPSSMAEIQIQRSIISGNSGGDVVQSNPQDHVSLGSNLIGTGNAQLNFGQIGDRINFTNPLLAPLGDYGGRTPTMPPWPNSPAVDAGGIVNSPLTDQRGISKPVGSAVDIGAVEAITATVLNTDDSGPGSLREVLATIPTGGTIGFSPVFLAGQTITLTSGQLSTDKKVAIGAVGLSGGITLDAASNSRILEVLPGGVVALDSFTLINGSSTGNTYPENTGGAVFVSAGGLALNKCQLVGNVTSGFNSQGGGAVYALSSEVWIKDSTLTDNSANNGGGIAIYGGRALIEQSTFAANSATFGGGLFNLNGRMDVTQSSLAGNSGSVFGGGVASAGNPDTETFIGNSIIGENSGGDVAVVEGTENSFNSYGGNIIGTGTGASAFTEPNDQTGITELLLEPLGDYGGPMPTQPPLPESPAIDNANAVLSGADQRGYSRAFGTATDAGAVEYQGTLVVTSNADAGPGSLRDTMRGIGFGGVISFDPNLSGQTIDLVTGELVLDRSMTIDGSGLPVAITLDAGGASRVFRASGEISASLSSLTLTGGFTGGSPLPNGYGGAMLVNEGADITLSNATVAGNSASLRGGGLSLRDNSSLTVENVTITQNEAILSGSGIVQSDGELTLRHSTISANGQTQYGALHVLNGLLNLDNSIVAGNAGEQLTIEGSLSGGNNFTDGDPMLAQLNDFEGPTHTMPPLPGSPVIDAAQASALVVDQKGESRPNGALPDIGAVEAFAFSTIVLIDSDNDGIDDRLEPSYGLTVGTDDSTVDSDGDGTPDGVELGNMTDPNDPTDDFRILAVQPVLGFDPLTNPVLEFTLRTFPGLTYGFETSMELPGFTNWPEGDFEATQMNQTISIEWPTSPAFFRAIRR